MGGSFAFTDDEIQLLLEVFALNIKLNVNIVALIGSRLEINTNKYNKNLFRNILKIQPMAFHTVKTRAEKRIGGKPKNRTNFKKAVDTNKKSKVKIIFTHYKIIFIKKTSYRHRNHDQKCFHYKM